MAGIRQGSRGQATAEYAIMIGVVVAAVVGMQLYLKRGLNGKVKDLTDHVGSEIATSAGLAQSTLQYEPYYAQSDYNTTQGTTSAQDYKTGGTVDRTVSRDTTTRSGSSEQGVDLSQDDQWR